VSTLPERPRPVKLQLMKWWPYWPRLLPGRSAHRARAAFRALAARSSAVMLAARAGPPFLPPLRPRATAAGFLRFAMGPVCPIGHAWSRKYHLTMRERSRIISAWTTRRSGR
jgi:hypothetical protein